MKKYFSKTYVILFSIALVIYACSKDNGGSTTPPDPCAGVTIVVTGALSPATTGQSDGSINTSATGGGAGVTYKLNNGTYQASGTFSNLAKGTYTVTAKNADGCTGTATFTITETSACTGVPGPKFTEVKALVNAKCVTCHGGVAPSGNMNLTIECNIVLNKDNINNRAIVIGDMPQGSSLTTAEKQKITDWVNAGGRYTD